MEFTIKSEEGLPLRGDIDVPQKPRALAIIVHGFKGFKDWGFFPYLAESLCEAGFAACRFNMSRSGVGEGTDSFDHPELFAGDTYSRQVSDLERVVAHAHAQFPALPIFLIGHSRGGGVALLAAERVPQLRGVVTWSAIARADRWDGPTKQRWRADGFFEIVNSRTKQVMRISTDILDDFEASGERLDIRSAAGRLARPLLVIHGQNDESVPVAESQELASAGSDVAHAIIRNASHTYNAIHPLVDIPFELSLVVTLTTRFLVAHTETRTVIGM